MDRKTLIAAIAGSLAALLLLCILLVGVLDGIWPWDGIPAYGRLISNRAQATVGPKETTAPTEATPTGNQQGETPNNQQDPSKPTIGEATQEVPPLLPNENNTDINTEVGGVVIKPDGSITTGNNTQPTTPTTGSTGEATENTTGNTGPTEEQADATIDAAQIPGW